MHPFRRRRNVTNGPAYGRVPSKYALTYLAEIRESAQAFGEKRCANRVRRRAD